MSVALLALLGASAVADVPGNGVLDETVVTATRRAESILNYAGSATRVSVDDVDQVASTHSSEIVNRAAGSMIQRGSGEESLIALRSPVLTGGGACGAFLILEDSIPIRPVGFCNVNELFEVDSEQAQAIEVLRGPGSALYGSNAMHGTINVLPANPAEMPALRLIAEFGSNEYWRGRFAGATRAAAIDYGLAALATHDGGFRDHSGFDEYKMNAALVDRRASGTLTLRFAGSTSIRIPPVFSSGATRTRTPRCASRMRIPKPFAKPRVNGQARTGRRRLAPTRRSMCADS